MTNCTLVDLCRGCLKASSGSEYVFDIAHNKPASFLEQARALYPDIKFREEGSFPLCISCKKAFIVSFQLKKMMVYSNKYYDQYLKLLTNAVETVHWKKLKINVTRPPGETTGIKIDNVYSITEEEWKLEDIEINDCMDEDFNFIEESNLYELVMKEEAGNGDSKDKLQAAEPKYLLTKEQIDKDGKVRRSKRKKQFKLSINEFSSDSDSNFDTDDSEYEPKQAQTYESETSSSDIDNDSNCSYNSDNITKKPHKLRCRRIRRRIISSGEDDSDCDKTDEINKANSSKLKLNTDNAIENFTENISTTETSITCSQEEDANNLKQQITLRCSQAINKILLHDQKTPTISSSNAKIVRYSELVSTVLKNQNYDVANSIVEAVSNDEKSQNLNASDINISFPKPFICKTELTDDCHENSSLNNDEIKLSNLENNVSNVKTEPIEANHEPWRICTDPNIKCTKELKVVLVDIAKDINFNQTCRKRNSSPDKNDKLSVPNNPLAALKRPRLKTTPRRCDVLSQSFTNSPDTSASAIISRREPKDTELSACNNKIPSTLKESIVKSARPFLIALKRFQNIAPSSSITPNANNNSLLCKLLESTNCQIPDGNSPQTSSKNVTSNVSATSNVATTSNQTQSKQVSVINYAVRPPPPSYSQAVNFQTPSNNSYSTPNFVSYSLANTVNTANVTNYTLPSDMQYVNLYSGNNQIGNSFQQRLSNANNPPVNVINYQNNVRNDATQNMPYFSGQITNSSQATFAGRNLPAQPRQNYIIQTNFQNNSIPSQTVHHYPNYSSVQTIQSNNFPQFAQAGSQNTITYISPTPSNALNAVPMYSTINNSNVPATVVYKPHVTVPTIANLIHNRTSSNSPTQALRNSPKDNSRYRSPVSSPKTISTNISPLSSNPSPSSAYQIPILENSTNVQTIVSPDMNKEFQANQTLQTDCAADNRPSSEGASKNTQTPYIRVRSISSINSQNLSAIDPSFEKPNESASPLQIAKQGNYVVLSSSENSSVSDSHPMPSKNTKSKTLTTNKTKAIAPKISLAIPSVNNQQINLLPPTQSQIMNQSGPSAVNMAQSQPLQLMQNISLTNLAGQTGGSVATLPASSLASVPQLVLSNRNLPSVITNVILMPPPASLPPVSSASVLPVVTNLMTSSSSNVTPSVTTVNVLSGVNSVARTMPRPRSQATQSVRKSSGKVSSNKPMSSQRTAPSVPKPIVQDSNFDDILDLETSKIDFGSGSKLDGKTNNCDSGNAHRPNIVVNVLSDGSPRVQYFLDENEPTEIITLNYSLDDDDDDDDNSPTTSSAATKILDMPSLAEKSTNSDSVNRSVSNLVVSINHSGGLGAASSTAKSETNHVAIKTEPNDNVNIINDCISVVDPSETGRVTNDAKHPTIAENDGITEPPPSSDPTTSPSYVCTVCKVKFETGNDLDRHRIDKHWEHRCYMKECVERFADVNMLKQHIIDSHTKTASALKMLRKFKLFKCDLCCKRYYDPKFLKPHMKLEHKNNIPIEQAATEAS